MNETMTDWDRRFRFIARLAIRFLLASLTAGAFLQLLSHGLRWASELPIILIAGIAGAGLTALYELYGRERQVVNDVRIGWAILMLRMALFLLVLTMLNQPVLRWTRTVHVERKVAVLVDDSASMHAEERLWTPGETLDVAALLTGKNLPGRPDIQVLCEHLVALQMAVREEAARPSAGEEEGDRVVAFKRKIEKTAGILETWAHAVKPAALLGARDKLVSQVVTLVEDAAATCRQRVGQVDKSTERGANLAVMSIALDNAMAGIQPLRDRIDKDVYESLDAVERATLTAVCKTNRSCVAARILMDKNRAGLGVIQTLTGQFGVETFVFADGARRAPRDSDNGPGGFRLRTDLAKAFDLVRQQIPATQLAGVLLLTDGCDNGDSGLDRAIRRLGVPIHPILIGGTRRPVDASLLALRAPDSIYLADRVRVLAQVQVTGAKGKTVTVTLRCEGKVVSETQVTADSDFFQHEVRLAHVPAEKGISHYRVDVSSLRDEYSSDNNARDFDVAVSDDRLNVLLVDSYPRWEFKYLRNLFYGRDKSVKLQFVLLNPDELPGQSGRPVVHASVSRSYEDAEATALPDSPEEWGKFGVIIIGDIGPESLSEAAVKAIREAVAERGALLAVISGPRNMPHRWSSKIWTDMMPLTWSSVAASPWATSPDAQFRLRLTAEGRQHMLAALSDDATENDEIWTRLPPMSWRAPFNSLKPGAQLIAYAEPVAGQEKPQGDERSIEKNALMAIQQYGQGKVAMLGYDQTWRLRYEVGDTYHHRFWGQIVRWGAGESLRAGGEFVRLGTDRLNYSPGETVRVTARVLDKNRSAVKAAGVVAAVYDGDKLQARMVLANRKGSYGLYEGEFPAMALPGNYRVKLEGASVDRILAETRQGPVQTVVSVKPPPNYLEFMRLNADEALVERVASLSGGAVHHPCSALTETIQFGPGSTTRTDVVEKVIWESWLWFLLVVVLVTAEWLLRRKGGLV